GDSFWKMTGKSLRHGLSEPLSDAPLISMILLLCGVTLPELGVKMLDQLGSTTSGVDLYAVGVTVGIRSIKLRVPEFVIA
ncbi:AEC family transporter, partial [Bacillus vallismortis]|nr:AEC family transporter [Bacillus vallismortis]